MNAQMRLVIMLTSVAVSGSLLFAAEPAPPAQKTPAPAGSAQPASPQKTDDKASAEKKGAEPKGAEQKTSDGKSAEQKAETPPAEDQDPAKKRAASAADKAGSPQRFNPSEQVRADFDVSFPIDI